MRQGKCHTLILPTNDEIVQCTSIQKIYIKYMNIISHWMVNDVHNVISIKLWWLRQSDCLELSTSVWAALSLTGRGQSLALHVTILPLLTLLTVLAVLSGDSHSFSLDQVQMSQTLYKIIETWFLMDWWIKVYNKRNQQSVKKRVKELSQLVGVRTLTDTLCSVTDAVGVRLT